MRRTRRWLLILAALPVALHPGPAGAQGSPGAQSVDSILSAMRGERGAAVKLAGGILASLSLRPDLWPRERIDSLATGVVNVLLENRHLNVTSVLARILGTEASDGRTVGSAEQMVTLAEAAGSRDRLLLSSIHKKMDVFAEDPIVVDWLVGVATSDDAEVSDFDRMSAVQALSESQRGQASLRLMHARDEARGLRTRALLKRLAERDFRSGGGEE